MKLDHIKNFKGGWFIGNFDPSVLKTDLFEVGVANHKKGDFWPMHYHKEITEYNLLLKGKIKLQNTVLTEGSVFVIPPWEISDSEFLEDSQILIIKTPSLPKDKFIVQNENSTKTHWTFGPKL